ncbi:hypothetical protein [Pedobacter sp. B4-66]|uniref:hypothetical protein n=1 Tax=Pedobacter sp. B4-66 TaxID=2817280 RepID=UPI001BDA4EDF|nr:hypothetical protein [Pedobacter sp. B4-66]
MTQQNETNNSSSEFSIKKLINERITDVKYIFNFKKQLFIVVLIGGILGALVAWMKPANYTARLSFVVDDSKSGGGAGLAGLAGQLGFNLDGLSGAGGVLSGDNVQELLKSRKLIKATLLTPYDSTKNQSLADRYFQVYELNKKWEKHLKAGEQLTFPIGGKNNTRLQDSLLQEMSALILKGEFSITKTDKKLSFFEINTTMRDEGLANLFSTRMLNQATDFFISTKTQRLRNNVNRLQHRADSIGVILNRKTYAASAASQTLLDLNPAYSSANATAELKERDKIVLSTIFTETVKNLEMSKTMLAQETPTVQIVDEPELPLKRNKLKYPYAILIGMLLSGIVFAVYLNLVKKDPNQD